jgi:hypothetical protein
MNINDSKSKEYLPKGFKIFVLILTVPVIISILTYYWQYMFGALSLKSPVSLGLPSILIFCLVIVISTFVPWEKKGVSTLYSSIKAKLKR